MRARLATAACVLLLALAGCGNDDNAKSNPTPSATTTPGTGTPSPPATTASPRARRIIRVVVANGKVTEGQSRVEVRLGETILIEVVSDAADEVHVHGYDEEFEVGPGKPGTLELKVRIPGTVDVELHEADLLLFQLRAR
jgi:hypothetical protein